METNRTSSPQATHVITDAVLTYTFIDYKVLLTHQSVVLPEPFVRKSMSWFNQWLCNSYNYSTFSKQGIIPPLHQG